MVLLLSVSSMLFRGSVLRNISLSNSLFITVRVASWSELSLVDKSLSFLKLSSIHWEAEREGGRERKGEGPPTFSLDPHFPSGLVHFSIFSDCPTYPPFPLLPSLSSSLSPRQGEDRPQGVRERRDKERNRLREREDRPLPSFTSQLSFFIRLLDPTPCCGT